MKFKIRFTGTHGEGLQFVEAEDEQGNGIRLGAWEKDGEYSLLVVDTDQIQPREEVGQREGVVTVLGIKFERDGDEDRRYHGEHFNLYRYGHGPEETEWTVEAQDDLQDVGTRPGASTPEEAIRSARDIVSKLHEGLQKARIDNQE